MLKLNNPNWLENDDVSKSTAENNEKKTNYILPRVIPYENLPLGTTTHTLSQMWVFPQNNILCKKPAQMHTIQYLDLFVIHRECFIMNAANKNLIAVAEKPFFTQSSKSSPLVLDSLKNKQNISSLFGSNSFGTVDYKTCIKPKKFFLSITLI